MKRLHPEKLDRQMDQHTEQVIRESADESNEKQDVYTEALAEVYLKQGLREKALEVYRKLSLLDPSKSAYFAARIDELKEF
jgi:lipopolysaccharide biosynthesis regulator YciM